MAFGLIPRSVNAAQPGPYQGDVGSARPSTRITPHGRLSASRLKVDGDKRLVGIAALGDLADGSSEIHAAAQALSALKPQQFPLQAQTEATAGRDKVREAVPVHAPRQSKRLVEKTK